MLTIALLVLSPVLALIVIGLLAALALNPEYGIDLLALTLPLASFPVIGDSGLFKMAGILAFGAWLLNVVIGRRPLRPVANFCTVALMAFAAISLVSAARAGTDDAWLNFERLVLAIGLYLAVIGLVASWAQVTRILRLMALSGAAIIAICLYLFVNGSDIVRHAAAGFVVPRLQGVDAGVNAFADLAAVLLMVTLTGPFSGKLAFWGRITIPIYAAAVVLTGSREAFVAVVLAMVLYVLIGRHRVYGILGAIVLAAIPIVMPTGYFERIATIWEAGEQGLRTQLYPAALRAFAHHPIIGFGLAMGPHALYPYTSIPMELSSHNTVLEVMVEQGLIGTLPFALAALFVGAAWFYLLRDRKFLSGDARRSAEALLLASLVIGVCAMFIDLGVTPILYLLAALLVAAVRFETHILVEC